MRISSDLTLAAIPVFDRISREPLNSGSRGAADNFTFVSPELAEWNLVPYDFGSPVFRDAIARLVSGELDA